MPGAAESTGGPGSLSRVRTIQLAGAGLSLIAICYGLARFAYGLFVPVFRGEFGLDGATAGAIAASSYLSYSVAIVVATVSTAKWGARVVAVAAGLVATAGTALIAASPNGGILAVGVVVAGASTGLASPPLAEAVARGVAAQQQDRVQTVVNAGTGLGVLASGPVALLLRHDWRLAWLVFAGMAALVTLWTAVTVPRRHEFTLHTDAPSLSASGLPRPLLPAGAVRLLAAAGVMGAASSAVWTFGRDVVESASHISPQASTAFWILLGAAGMLGALAGDLTARAGIRRAWQAAILALAAATALLGAAPSSYPATFSSAAIFGAVYIGLTGMLLLWGTRVYPQTPSTGVGLAFLMIAVGQAAGSPLVGVLMDLSTPATAFLAAAGLAALGTSLPPTGEQGR